MRCAKCRGCITLPGTSFLGYTWTPGTWGDCSKACDGGTRSRDVNCRAGPGAVIIGDASNCKNSPKPTSQGTCNAMSCAAVETQKQAAQAAYNALASGAKSVWDKIWGAVSSTSKKRDE